MSSLSLHCSKCDTGSDSSSISPFFHDSLNNLIRIRACCIAKSYNRLLRNRTLPRAEGGRNFEYNSMKHNIPERRDPFNILQRALSNGWSTMESVSGPDDGHFLVVTMSGLIRLAKNHRYVMRLKGQNGYGPAGVVVRGVATKSYHSAIAWKWPEIEEEGNQY